MKLCSDDCSSFFLFFFFPSVAAGSTRWGESRNHAFWIEECSTVSACSCHTRTRRSFFSLFAWSSQVHEKLGCCVYWRPCVMQVFRSRNADRVPVNLIPSWVVALIYWSRLVSRVSCYILINSGAHVLTADSYFRIIRIMHQSWGVAYRLFSK